MKHLLIITLLLLSGIACSSDNEALPDPDLPLSVQVDLLIDQNRYEQALSLLAGEDREDPGIRLALEKTHLNYALYSMNTFDQTEMRTRMNNALIHFAEVLKLNPNNIVAAEQIGQILSIYEMIPGRSPDPEVMKQLRELGFGL
ncbi:MAG: hypothetical protein EA360_00515 [Balneolaceae bacterium]|nr:MAG: hypothetical protein EA360_00515 [Balneolaceae bacterium]